MMDPHLLLPRHPIPCSNPIHDGLLFLHRSSRQISEFCDAVYWVLTNTPIELDQQAARHHVAINPIDPEQSLGDLHGIPDRTVIEIQNGIPVDKFLIVTVAKFVEIGYRIVLDGFSFQSDISKLLPFASFVKIDISSYANDSDLTHLINRLNEYSTTVLVEDTADKVQKKRLRSLGFALLLPD